MIQRRLSNQVYVGDVPIGGDAPVSIQSMTNTDPHDFSATYRQIKALEEAGCQIIRLTLPDTEAVETVRRLKKTDIKIPLVGDIHFDYRIALEAAGAGIDKIRINPGNIGAGGRVKAVATACKERHIPIRIGVNSGSLEKDILAKYGSPTAEALAESALYHASLLEKCDFGDIVISVKASDVKGMIEANRILAKKTSYPLHLGVTEAGGAEAGTVKSAVGIGTMLAEGIGDTV
ncbi:MAG: (E)-4-hydroxy-3-methylbut-2-enyl-diphosphate synthase, partial [Clostridia bacterium]|nr:(E)-4-hydroxy-3-methylbut-2-enyl-diphosphate synthase [Clostridia bacterium]